MIIFSHNLRTRLSQCCLIVLLLIGSTSPLHARLWPIKPESPLLLGVGDRVDWFTHRVRRATWSSAKALGQPTDLLMIWLPRGWKSSWIPERRLKQLNKDGTIPVILHYYFEDRISQQAIERDRDSWHQSLRHMGKLLKDIHPVLIVLEPEFNDAPPAGETHTMQWPQLANELSVAIDIVREQAPHAMISVGAGDFSPTRNLEPVIWPLVHKLDFLAYQEMRADTDPDYRTADYLNVGDAAVEYAAYLKQFGLPILLAYVALSSHGDWEQKQKTMLQQLRSKNDQLKQNGVFGVSYFQLFDDPQHQGYFKAAEKHFGLYTHDGTAKPAAEVFKEWGWQR